MINQIVGAFRFIKICFLIPVLYAVAVCKVAHAEGEQYRALVNDLARKLLGWMGVEMTYTGRAYEPTPSGSKGVLVLSNHTSFLDIMAIYSLMSPRFVAKAEIGTWPVFGGITRAVRAIFIERGHRRALIRVSEAMRDSLLAGQDVMFFPEGTTSPGDRLLPLHANLIEAAVMAESKIQPIVLKYFSGNERTTRMAYTDISIFHCLWNVVTTPHARIELEVLEPLDSSLGNRHLICSRVSEMMASALGVEDPQPKKLNAPQAAPSGLDQVLAGGAQAEKSPEPIPARTTGDNTP